MYQKYQNNILISIQIHLQSVQQSRITTGCSVQYTNSGAKICKKTRAM